MPSTTQTAAHYTEQDVQISENLIPVPNNSQLYCTLTFLLLQKPLPPCPYLHLISHP